jgi:nucleotidyltransferase substrate binding protein (TIGR01987 family)
MGNTLARAALLRVPGTKPAVYYLWLAAYTCRSQTESTMTADIRWKQRFSNYLKALQTLAEAAELAQHRELTKLEQQGLIQGFEFTHELAWNVLKDYLEEQGFVGIIGSKNASRQAFKNALIQDGEAWMDMIKARNLTSHTYNLDVAAGIASDILTRFYPAFAAMATTFIALDANPVSDA